MKRPVYLLFAGVNGAGKSTYYHGGFWRSDSLPSSLPRINSDEILVEQGGDSSSAIDQMCAGREALRRLNDYLDKGISFNQETTLTGHTCIRAIERARQAGYRIEVYYIGVSSADTALARIEHRRLLGGHIIDENVVRRRWRASLSNLSRVVRICDEVNVIDNTIDFMTIARWTNGALSWTGNLKKYGTWLLDAVFDDEVWN